MLRRRFLLTVLLPGVVLLLFGLRTLEQDRLAVEQHIRVRLANTSELAARAIDQQLANWSQFHGDGVMLTGQPLRAEPPDATAYEFQQNTLVPELDPALADAERQELRGEWDKAITLYRKAAEVPAVRVQALLRLAATYSKRGRPDLAASVYASVLRQPHQPFGA